MFIFFSNRAGWLRSIAISIVGTIALLLVVRACTAPVQGYTVLSPQASPLREHFNEDATRTRILILPAPN